MRQAHEGPRRWPVISAVAAVVVLALLAMGCSKTETVSMGASAPLPADTVATTDSTARVTSNSAAPELSDDEAARQAVFAYLNGLASGDFETAAWYYGDVLTAPGATKAERLENAIRLRRVFPPQLVRIESHGWEQIVWVQLIQSNGKPYVLSRPEGSQDLPIDEFPFTALRVDGRWWVMDLPPYEE